jgi:hypothetical protein
MVAFVCISLAALLAERQRREEQRARAEQQTSGLTDGLAERLRAEYHPKQRAFCTSRAKQRAAKCTRRAGKTRGGCRETLARALEGRQRWLYCSATRDEAYRRAWRTDSRDGWCDLLEQLGVRVAKSRTEYDRNPQTVALVNEQRLTIDFRNGSQLAIFAADRPEDQDKLRGGQKDGVWVDEAQIFPGLTHFVDEVCDALVKQPGGDRGEIWLTGTPARTLAGLFYEATKEPEQGERIAGWEVHEFSVADNPYFGSTSQERWDNTAGATLKAKGWDIEDPPPKFVREWLGKWTKGDALYVYAVHARPPDVFAPCRVDPVTGIYQHSLAVRDLPEWVEDVNGDRRRIRWYFALGADFGFSPAAFAWTMWAFSPDTADIYEMGSFKKHEQLPRQISAHLNGVWNQCKDTIAVCVGDAAGGSLETTSLAGWSESTGLPMQPAEKRGKRTWIEHYNGELYAGNLHYREDSVLLAEQKELQWRAAKAAVVGQEEGDDEIKLEEWPDRRTSTGERCGNDASDSSLYPYRHLISRRLEFAAAPKTEAERLAREEARMLEAVKASTRRALEREHGYDDA